MTEQDRKPGLSRRGLVRGTTAAAAIAAALPLISCTTEEPRAAPSPSAPPATGSAPPRRESTNVRINDGSYGVHVEPSVAANPLDRRQLLAACQVSPTADPEFIATYLSSDAGATWRSGGLPQFPGGAGKTGDDVTVAFDVRGRGYVCATSYSGGRAVYVWRTDDGGRSYSAPVTLVADEYCDHPWMAISERTVYVAWASGDKSGLAFTRSTDGGETFETPRTILEPSGVPVISSAPTLAAGPTGLVLAAYDRMPRRGSSGETSQVGVMCSTDAGKSFGPSVWLGEESPIIGLPDGVQPVGSPAAAIAPDGSALYVAFTRHQQGAVHSDIVVAASRDSGRTWSQAVPATPTDDVTYFQPNMTVDESGRIVISAFALANGRVDVVALVSQPRQLRFGPPLWTTTAAFDPAHSPTTPGKHGAWWIGDYQGIATGDGAVHLIWNDTRTGKLELFAATVHP